MDLKILLPYRIFADIKNVSRIIAETNEGFFGILPHRLDCVAALVPGIFSYQTDNGQTHYIAIDNGVLIKTDSQVFVSVRNAIIGTDLGKLRELVEKEYLELDENEKNVRSVMAKMESGFIYSLQKFSDI